MKLSDLIERLEQLKAARGGSLDVKLRFDDELYFGVEFTDFYFEERKHDIVLTADAADLENEEESIDS